MSITRGTWEIGEVDHFGQSSYRLFSRVSPFETYRIGQISHKDDAMLVVASPKLLNTIYLTLPWLMEYLEHFPEHHTIHHRESLESAIRNVSATLKTIKGVK